MCAYLAEDEIATEEESFLVEKVLAGAPQAAVIASNANVKRLILTHIREKPDETINRMQAQVAAVFAGEVIVGRDLLTIDLP
jgi:ribonuclease BN (tRNA processing enzyme)